LKEKLIKIGAKVVSHGRYVAFQMAEVAIPRQVFQEILRLIAELRPPQPLRATPMRAVIRAASPSCQNTAKAREFTRKPEVIWGIPVYMITLIGHR
jgi:hypothetical protein